MPPSRSIQKIFADAIEMGDAERGPFLDLECAGDVDLRARVERLIRAHFTGADFLDGPVVADGVGPAPEEAITRPT